MNPQQMTTAKLLRIIAGVDPAHERLAQECAAELVKRGRDLTERRQAQRRKRAKIMRYSKPQ